MSHQVPEYYRYVSSIKIDNPGSGYTSVPTITIAGGGGSGATATASILNGQIQTINITAIGNNYTTAPTVTVSGGGGSGAQLSAILAVAAGTPTEYTEKSSIGVKYTLPEFIQNDYDQFVTFIEKYYEYMDSDGNPINVLLNKKYNDIDDLSADELDKRAEELTSNFPQLLQTDRKTLLKNVKNIYETKGSERSIKAYFKLLYNQEVEIFYPSKTILKASDGVWIERKSVKALSGYNNYEVLNLNSALVDIIYFETESLPRKIEASVIKSEKTTYTSPQSYEIFLELPPGTTSIPGPGAQATATATVSSTETEYNNGAIINVTGDGSDFFKREVTVNGVRIMGAGTVGGQQAVPDAWLEKVARMFELFLDPNGAGINETLQRNLIKTLSGDVGTWHAGLPTLQRVARGAGSDYTPNFLTDAGVISWNLTPLFDSHVANDMVWYLNSTGSGYGVGEIDAQEVIEHVFHTLHMHGLTDDIKLYSYISADWATGPLYAAMEEAFDAGKWDPSGYQSPSNAWKTDADAFQVAAKEYLFLLNFAMFDYTGLWEGDSLAPEWADDVRTPAQIQATLPISYTFFNTYISPAISKPSLATINSIFGDGNTPAQDDPSLAGASGYVVDTVVGGEITDVTVVSGGYDYTAAPTVVLTGDGTGATATATVSNGAITSVAIVNRGSGYTSATVSFDTTNVRSVIVNRGDTSAAENVLAYLDRSLSSVTSGTYSGVDAGFSVGDIFTITEPSGVATSTVRVSSVDEKNVPTEWTTINSGNGFTKSRFTVTLQSKTNENLDVDFITGYLYQYAGEYKGSRGQVSNVNRLQDNFKYQSYSYVIKSGISQDVWIKRFRDLMHPSGMEVFGDLILKHNVNFAPFFQISTNGLNIHVFKTEDIVISNDDQFTRVVQWVRAFSETQTVGDISTLEVEKNVTEILSASDAYDQDEYVCCDYLPINYVGSGVGKNIGKVLSDNPVTSEIFAPAVNFVRSFADEVANSTDSIVLALAISTTLSDATNAATDVIILSSETNFLDTAGASDAYDQDNYAGPDALPINYVGSGVSKVLEKIIVDTSLATEQLESVVAFVRVFDESVSLTDTNSFGVNRTFTETLSTADSFSHQIFIPINLTDTSTVADVFIATYNKEISEVVNTTDVLSINNSNGIVESLSVTEVSRAVMQKPFVETSIASDSGIITIQDYADPTFFGEDYVGAGYNI